ncbi:MULTISPECIES: DUF2510 domain-containing protein [unclassified Streptomyces]|uniref:DUF2510 domain-containing protein n=1 Tax=unclassified Streptomyces TaxID=2593676 RepID=UPI00278BFA1B|nr:MULTISPECIES: DUF2510 domain-containing protein [unclassified Streptomyces]
MTSQTPAGWYPDPGQVPGGPRTERWWDGARWTDQTRPAATTPPPPETNPAYPNYPGDPGQLPSKPRGRGRIAIAAGIAVVVLAGIGTGVYALTSGGGGGKNEKADSRSEHPGSPEDPKDPKDPKGQGGPGDGESPSPDSPGSSPRPPLDEGYATDVGNGVAIPVIKNWTGTDGLGLAGVTVGPYPCPNAPDQSCVKGGATTSSAKRLKLDAKAPEAAAKEDIAKNAKSSYGGKTYEGITKHKELFSKAVTVAGQKGYRVRWSVETKSGVDAWVESVAFRSPANPGKLVVLRAGVDVPRTAMDKAKGPDAGSIDKIVKGVKKAEVTGDGDTGENV